MYLLSEKLRKFLLPLVIASLMSWFMYFFSKNKDLDINGPYYYFVLIYLLCGGIVFFLYVVYPSIKILLNKYGGVIQRIILVLLLGGLFLSMYISSVELAHTFVCITYLAIFLNFSSKIGKKNQKYYILSYPIGENSQGFENIVNSSSFNVLMSVILLIFVVSQSLQLFVLYKVSLSILAVILVISSIVYGKSDKSIDY